MTILPLSSCRAHISSFFIFLHHFPCSLHAVGCTAISACRARSPPCLRHGLVLTPPPLAMAHLRSAGTPPLRRVVVVDWGGRDSGGVVAGQHRWRRCLAVGLGRRRLWMAGGGGDAEVLCLPCRAVPALSRRPLRCPRCRATAPLPSTALRSIHHTNKLPRPPPFLPTPHSAADHLCLRHCGRTSMCHPHSSLSLSLSLFSPTSRPPPCPRAPTSTPSHQTCSVERRN